MMNTEDIKNNWEGQSCVAVQTGLAALFAAIRDGSYLHPKTKTKLTVEGDCPETIFLRSFSQEIQPFFEVKLNLVSLDELGTNKSNMLLYKHGAAIPEAANALDVLNKLYSHNLADKTTLEDGSKIPGNRGMSVKIFSRFRMRADERLDIVFNATCISAILFDATEENRYLTFYATILRNELINETNKASKRNAFDKLPETFAEQIMGSVVNRPQSRHEAVNEHYQIILGVMDEIARSSPAQEKRMRRLRKYLVDGETYDSIALQEGVSKQAVFSIVTSALEQLRGVVKEKGIHLD